MENLFRRAKDTRERINKDNATREVNSHEEFTMTVGNRAFSCKGARA